MKKIFLTILLSAVFSLCNAQKKINALIIDGQNNHDQWPKITYMMKTYLEKSGRFEVDVQRTAFTWNGNKLMEQYKIEGMKATEALENSKQDLDFQPEFKKYDLVVVNFGWNAAPWSDQTQKDFEKYVKKGGGVVIVHAANNSFPKWPAYNEMIGLGGWGDRSEKDGPYVYFDETGELKRDMTPGRAGSHGPQHEYTIDLRDTEHPITKGMPLHWAHTIDELYDRLRGPAKNMKVLATAYSSGDRKGTDRHEPMLLTIDYGEGRIFHTPMGHIDQSWECVGLITSFLRGAEWAATGKVTIPVPSDFPTQRERSWRNFD